MARKKSLNPTTEQLKALRLSAGLSQPAAAALVHSTKRTWQDWESGPTVMHAALYELFCLRISRGLFTVAPLKSPKPHQIAQARKAARLSQPAAAALIHSTKRTWQDWEGDKSAMHPGLWEMFLFRLVEPFPPVL